MTGFSSWKDHFINTETPCCEITQCTLETSDDNGVTWDTSSPTDPVQLDNDMNLVATRDNLAGYTSKLKVTCSDASGNQVSDDRLVVSQSAFDCTLFTCTASTLQDKHDATGSGDITFT